MATPLQTSPFAPPTLHPTINATALNQQQFPLPQQTGIDISVPGAIAGPQQFPTAQAPVAPISQIPTGLLGAEQALGGAAQGSIGAQLEGLNVARGDISQGGQNALTQLGGASSAITQGTTGGINAIAGSGQAALGQLGGAQQAIQAGTGQATGTLAGAGLAGLGQIGQGVSTGTGFLQGAQQQGLDFLQGSTQQAVSPLTGFQQSGQQANQLQAAFSGALGPEAQAQAFQNFQESPGQQFLREQQERARIRNAAALGGLGGGRVRSQLESDAAGRAALQFDTRFGQLGQLSGQGLQAGGQIAQLFGNQGAIGTNLIGQTGQGLANLAQTGGLAGANLLQNVGGQISGLQAQSGLAQADVFGAAAGVEQNVGSQIAQLSQSEGFAQADIGSKAAMIEESSGVNLANLAQQTGLNVARTLENLGSQSAEVRTQAGRDIANAIASTSEGLAGLQQQQGAGISDIIGSQISNIGNLLVNAGFADAASQEQLATLLGNLAVGSGTQAANISNNIARINAAGILGQSSILADSITKLGEVAGNSGFLKKLTTPTEVPT